MFDQMLESSSNRQRTKKWWTIWVSAAIQISLISILVIIPLIYTDTITATMMTTMLTAPPPPPPPPPPPAATVVKIVKPQVHLIQAGKLVAPTAIPKQVNIIKEEAAPPEVASVGVAGGVPGGVPGGQVGGVIGGIIGGVPTTVAPPPPPKETPHRIPVGGNVQKAMLQRQVTPVYPMIARQARMQGTIRLHAIISEDGTIQELTYVSGPQVFLQSAMDAVRQWKYRPTTLNGTAVQVDTTIDVIFTLGG